MFKSFAQKRFTFYLILPEPPEKISSYNPRLSPVVAGDRPFPK